MCSVRNTSDNCRFPIAQKTLDCVLSWQTAVRVLGSLVGPAPDARSATGSGDFRIEAHVEELQRRHHTLETEIAEAHAHPSIDDLEVPSLKRRKLLVKDELVGLKN